MPIPYNINPTTRGVNGFGLQASDLVYSVLLDAAVEATLTVPASLPLGAIGMIGSIAPYGDVGQEPIGHNKWIAVFRYGKKVAANIVVSLNQTAVLPTANSFALLGASFTPDAWNVKAGDVIHVIADTNDAAMSVEFYNITE